MVTPTEAVLDTQTLMEVTLDMAIITEMTTATASKKISPKFHTAFCMPQARNQMMGIFSVQKHPTKLV